MRRWRWQVAHVALTLACLAGVVWLVVREWRRPVETGRASEHADFALRSHLGMRTLGGEYESPPGAEHLAIIGLQISDGQVVERWPRSCWSVQEGESRVVPFVMMWETGKTKVTVHSFGSMKTECPFLPRLDGSWAQAVGTRDLGEFRGYRVIGYAASREVRPGKERFREIAGLRVGESVEAFRDVLVLGVRSFGTKEEASDWADNGRDE